MVFTADTRAATQALSSRWRERTNPAFTSTRGSNATKSPTPIPRSSVSLADMLRASRRTSSVSSLRFNSPTSPPNTWLEAFVSRMEPRIFRPDRVETVQPSPSMVFQAKPPILDNFRRPLDLTSFTIPPSVSTCAVTARGPSSCSPRQVAVSAPLRVRPSVSSVKALRASSVNASAASALPVGEAVFNNLVRKSIRKGVLISGSLGMISSVVYWTCSIMFPYGQVNEDDKGDHCHNCTDRQNAKIEWIGKVEDIGTDVHRCALE